MKKLYFNMDYMQLNKPSSYINSNTMAERMRIVIDPVKEFKCSFEPIFSLPEFILTSSSHTNSWSNHHKTPCALIQTLRTNSISDSELNEPEFLKSYIEEFRLSHVSDCLIGIVDNDSLSSVSIKFDYGCSIEGKIIQISNASKINRKKEYLKDTEHFSFISDEERDKYKNIWVISDSPIPISSLTPLTIRVTYKTTPAPKIEVLSIVLPSEERNIIHKFHCNKDAIECAVCPDGRQIMCQQGNTYVTGLKTDDLESKYYKKTFEKCKILTQSTTGNPTNWKR